MLLSYNRNPKIPSVLLKQEWKIFSAPPSKQCTEDMELCISMKDKELVRMSLEGDEQAFGTLVNRFKTKVFNMAFSATRDRDTADDLAQEVFIKVYFALHKFRHKAEFGTWLYRLTVNHIRDYLRKARRIRKLSFEDTGEPPSTLEEKALTREEEQEKDTR